MREQAFWVDPRIGRLEETQCREANVHPRGVAVKSGAQHAELRFDRRSGHRLGHPEVQKRDAPILEQQEVPRVGIARELTKPVERAEEESEHDLPHPVARRPGRCLHPLEAHPIHPFCDQYALSAQGGHDVRNDDEGVSAPAPRKSTLGLSFVLVSRALR